ncbi:MAG: hypothetical protein Q8902_12020, partial [Bacteroidota bacterium]|nr:hypothetical protein [Bacteroidota bacterium]
MKHRYVLRAAVRYAYALLGLVLLLAMPHAGAQAQNARIHHKIESKHLQAPQMGRDLWFTLITNYGPGGSGKYFALYVTSPNVTTVHVQLTSGGTYSIDIQPYKTAAFNIPLQWEMESSGQVEDMGVHVWSTNADICAYVMSHNPYTSDGMYIIPTIGWGTEYVVAAYAALFEGFGSYVFDLPSEFGIVADQDNTRISITPTQDVRVEGSNGACCSCVMGHQGQTFQVVLNRGQSIEFKTTCTTDCDNFDLTGTVIKSNNPIGVEAGSQCPNIPCDFPYCDHVLDYIPPVRTWAKTYYSIPFYQPPGATLAHNASTFLVIATKAGQVIKRYDNDRQQDQIYFTASKKYDFYWRNDIDQGSRWSSDQPFLLVQYINSSSYPDNVNGQGDPAEVVVPSSDQFTKQVVFQTPISIGNKTPYTNYVSIIAHYGDNNVILDGKSVKNLTRVYIDGIFEGYRAGNVAPGGHVITSDSGVGVYIYGYGFDESYAWTGSFATNSFNSPDTIPPVADTSGQCLQAHVNLSDLLSGGDSVTGIYYIRVDSVNNMGYLLDSSWIEGKAKPKSLYDMTVADPTKPAILIVSVFDQAGNSTTITSTYVPQDARLGPPLQDFGVGNPSNCVMMYDTIVNTQKTPYHFKSISLVLGDQGFSFASDTVKPASPIGIDSVGIVKICFKSIKGSTVFDTLRVDDGCFVKDVILTGTGGQPDFRITGHDWGTQLLGTSSVWDGTKGAAIEIVNTSPNQPIKIDSMWVDDPVHFKPTMDSHWATSTNPVILGGKGIDVVTYTFTTTDPPDTAGQYRTMWHALSKQLISGSETGIRSNNLTGLAVTPGRSFYSNIDTTITCASAGNDVLILTDTIAASGTSATTISKVIHSSPYFTNFTVTRNNGTLVANPSNMQEALNPGDMLFVSMQFDAPLSKDSTFIDTVWAYYVDDRDGTTQLIGGQPLILKVHVIYRSGVVSNGGVVNFAPVKYQSPVVCQTLTITDTTDEPLDVSGYATNVTYASSFKITGLPVTLQPHQSVTVTICFDPSVSFDAKQDLAVTFTSPNSCTPLTAEITAYTTVGGAAGQGYAASGFSACDNPTRTVTVYNLQPKDASGEVADTIAAISFKSGKNFSVLGNPIGDTVHGQGSLPVQIMFIPDQVGGRNFYSDTLFVELKSSRSDTTVAIYVADTGVTQAVTATAGSGASVIGQTFTLPISFSVNNNGLAEPLANRKISQ